MQVEQSKPLALFPLVLAFFGLIAVFHLGGALAGKCLFRAIHLGTALEFAHGPINLLKPMIVGYSANATPAPQELPLWQAAVGLVFKAVGNTWYGWASLVTLLLFATGLWPLFYLARQYAGERAAWWSLIFFLAQPLVVIAAGQACTDGFCLTLTLWFLFFADRFIRMGGVGWWLLTTVLAAVAAVSKLPFFMAAGFCSVFLLVLNRVRTWRSWLLLAAAGGVAAGVFVVWSHYTDTMLARAEYPYIQLRLSESPYMLYWYFGDLGLRLSPGPWIKGGWRFLHATLGSLPLVVFLGAALVRTGSSFAKLWLLATVLTTLVFTHLVLVHWHYYLMCCPAVALLCGATLARWEGFWAAELPQVWLRAALVAAALVGSAIDGVITSKIAIYYDYFPKQVAELLCRYTGPEDKIILYGGDWGGEELFRAGRRGFCVFKTESFQGTKGLLELLTSEADLLRLKGLGYTRLVLMSESPVRFAAVAVNPGSQRKRMVYPASISPAVDAWPVLYQSEDLLIKQIPK
jgi:hypothetical protein